MARVATGPSGGVFGGVSAACPAPGPPGPAGWRRGILHAFAGRA